MFKATTKTLKAIMTDEKVIGQLAERRVEWTFNIERAPWWGGVFENAFNKMLFKKDDWQNQAAS